MRICHHGVPVSRSLAKRTRFGPVTPQRRSPIDADAARYRLEVCGSSTFLVRLRKMVHRRIQRRSKSKMSGTDIVQYVN